jgi:hypothetical protein
MSREEFIPDNAGATTTMNLSYPPASLTDLSEVVFTARQTWDNSNGLQDYASPSAAVTDWHYVSNSNGTYSVTFTPPAAVPSAAGVMVAPDAGTIYSFVYRAKDPKVLAIGFAAVRDLVTFLKETNADAQGQANPLNDMKGAACAQGSNCPANPTTNFDVALTEGTSQSGRFLRNFLYRGFNKASSGKPVFDGMLAIIPAARRTWTAVRFGQQGRWSKQHEDHFMQGDQFPFSYTVLTDPVSGLTDGLLKRCLANTTCPKIMQIDGSFEWWGGRASLIVTDGAGKDVQLPSNVRYYLVPGTQHGGGGGVTTGLVTQPSSGSQCRYANSPVIMTPIERALLLALENWTVKNTTPPDSSYPTVARGELANADAVSMGAPNMSSVVVPNGDNAALLQVNIPDVGRINQLFVTDYPGGIPKVSLLKQYKLLVPKVNADGNETSGILTPELSVPLASYAGWNVRGSGHAAGESCGSSGSAIPFAVDTSKKANTDPRLALSERYGGRGDYIARFQSATDALVARGLLLPLDAQNIFYVNAAKVSSLLLPNP